MPIRIPENLKPILNVEEENDSVLQALALRKNAVLLALIAPYVPERISPTEYASASLGVSEEFGIETVISHIRQHTKCKNLYLVIHSPGGLVHSSYKIAKALRSNFKEITVFVPYLAASGGTLIALTGNHIVMGLMSYLTPIDPLYGSIPLNSLPRAFTRLVNYFEKREKDEASYPWIALTEKIDPIQLETYSGEIDAVQRYACEILSLSHPSLSKQEVEKIAKALILEFESHSTLIGFKDASRINLPVTNNVSHHNEWRILREWLGRYLLKSESQHFIRCVIPGRKATRNSKGSKK